MSESSTDTPISDADVASFLRDSPDFFVKHPNLLTELQLPHESGSAISLVERQVSVLRERNMEMRHRLSNLLDNARDNDKLFEKTKRLTLALLEAQDLGDLVDALMYSFDNEFKIHYTRLIIYNNPEKLQAGSAKIMSFNDARTRLPSLAKTTRAICGHLPKAELDFLFGKDAGSIGSAAATPLIHGQHFGLLAIGNRDPNYYKSSMGTLFLSYIGEILNRLLPKYLQKQTP